MKNIAKILMLIVSISIIIIGCTNSDVTNAEEITISVAASLRDPVDEIAKHFQQDKGIKVNINIGSSGSLQKQIEEGAPVDVFISAGIKQVNTLMEKNLADQESYRELLTNSLVLIVSKDYNESISSLDELIDQDIKLAIGEIQTVPVGQYAKEYMDNEGLWQSFVNRVVYGRDVKAVLSYVEAGEAEAGIVYHSDAIDLKNSYIAYHIPTNTHTEIIYPLIIISDSKRKAAAEAFVDYLFKPESKTIFSKYNLVIKE